MKMKKMHGVYAVELAAVCTLLFFLLLGVLEVGRLMFTVNALNESVRRGARLAAVCHFADVETIKERAVFGTADVPSNRIVGGLEPGNVTVSYLKASGVALSDAELATDSGYSSIRFVEVKITGFQAGLMIPLGILDILAGRENIRSGFVNLKLWDFRSVLPRESLGRYPEGTEPTPC